jgi:hypothetical protein
MFSENGLLIDFDEVRKIVESSDVFALAFAHFPERLLVDTRSNATETPLVQVVEPAGSGEQRLAWLQRRRPTLGKPEAFQLLPWPHSPTLLSDSGVWERILHRVGADADPQVDVQCSLAMRQLRNLDREALLAMINGDDCITIWPPEAEPPERG